MGHLNFVATAPVSKISWSQKFLAANSPSSTVAETADTTTILTRFCTTTIDNADATAAGGFALDVSLALVRFAFCGVVFAAIAFPGDGGSGRNAA
jgi:hypothetical protein